MVSGMPMYTDYVALYLVAGLWHLSQFFVRKRRSPLAMKILLAFFVLFAAQIIPLEAQMHQNNNALTITGIDTPEIKFWKNPFSSEKGMFMDLEDWENKA